MANSIQLTFDAADPDGLARFWKEVLHYRFPDPPTGHATWEDWASEAGVPDNAASALEDPDGNGPRIYFQRVPEGKVTKNRLHMDVGVSGGRAVPMEERKRAVDAEVIRLKALGASDERGSKEENDTYWVRMNDPEGNEFCIH